jgi:ABC-type multidrug transport system ATPase subunit
VTSRAQQDFAVQFDSVVKDFAGDWSGRKVQALKGVSLTIPRGCIAAIIGPNGSGKSTLLKIAAGLTQPTSGNCQSSHRVSYLPETTTLPPLMTPRQILELFAFDSGADTEREIGGLLELVGLQPLAHRRLGELSKGLRHRAALAVALAGKPELLVLDEPTDGLDPRAISELLAILRAVRSEGRTVLLASHFLAAIDDVADLVGLMEQGRLIFAGRREDVARRGGVERIYLEATAR